MGVGHRRIDRFFNFQAIRLLMRLLEIKKPKVSGRLRLEHLPPLKEGNCIDTILNMNSKLAIHIAPAFLIAYLLTCIEF